FPTLSRDLLCKAGPISPTGPHPIVFNGGMRRTIGKHYDSALVTRQNGGLSHSLQKPTQPRFAALPVSSEMQELESIIYDITESKSTVRQQYGQDMMQSLGSLKTLRSAPKQGREQINPAELSAEISKAQQVIQQQFGQLCAAFEQRDSRVRWLQEGGIWPCITPITLLEQLRSTSASVFGDRMKEGLVVYASSI